MSSDSKTRDEQSEEDQWSCFSKGTLFGGFLTAALGVAGIWAAGRVGSTEAKVLLESLFPTTRFLCSSVMTGSATILALMLTLLGLTQNTEGRFKPIFYERIGQIAWLTTITFAGATVLLLGHNVPIGQSDKVPSSWFEIVYYVLMIWSAVISGMLVVIVLALYRTVRNIINAVGAHRESSILVEEEG